jgi:hypothetical protein
MGGEHRDAAAEVADMELRRLTIFRAAAECASFKQAADRLAVNASGITRGSFAYSRDSVR